MSTRLIVNGESRVVDAAPDTPLLYVLRNDLGLNGPKFGCGLGQCGACAAIVGGNLVKTCTRRRCCPACSTSSPRPTEAPREWNYFFMRWLANLARHLTDDEADAIEVLREAALINPDDEEIRNALADHLCRCGVHNRVVRAVRRAAVELAR